ncbi:MAG: hypothetical protein H0U74_10835, partial [Bradymonadaceae bacterium]|nr:hypothetical protein [Lujinxingiaceae bacterium]
MALLDEIEFRVYRSHIKIPLIFFVPAVCLLSIYVLLYFYVNSGWFVITLQKQLHSAFGGHFEVGKLEVEPSLTQVHIYDVHFLTPTRAPIIEARVVHAAINPLLVLGNRIQFDRGHVVGAKVRLSFDENGDLNLFDGLGFNKEQPEEQDDESGSRISVGFADVRIEDSEFYFGHSIFNFTIPDVNIPNASVYVEPATILMNVPELRVPRADFRFHPELFNFEQAQGDWSFTLRDFELDNWRWANEGFAVERLSADIEGYLLEVVGRMAFPSSEKDEQGQKIAGGPKMLYEARGKLSAPYWSPLLHYFTRDNIHFEIPELSAAVEGTLEEIDGNFEVHASVLEVAGLFFKDIRARLALENRFLVLQDGSASFHGGRIHFPYAYFSLLDTRYGAIADFEGVDPASALRELQVDLPWLEGSASGGLMLVGEIPKSPEYRGDGPYAALAHTLGRYADLVLTKPLNLARANRELIPVDHAVLAQGTQAWVD